ncbi:MAG: dicarboxylate/amino acid:cation symporter [Gammaproteobacteria bacterium]
MMTMLRKPFVLLMVALFLGILTGLYPVPFLVASANTVAVIFVKLLKLISLPLIFLAVVATLTQMQSVTELRSLGGRVLKYTLLTTIIAASIALCLFLVLNPVQAGLTIGAVIPSYVPDTTYWDYLLKSIPSNLITPFSEGNVIAVLILALLMSFAILPLPARQKNLLSDLFASLFAAMLSIAKLILKFIPIAIWAFITQFIVDMDATKELTHVLVYLICVVSANLIQAFIVLPLLLKFKGISPIRTAKAMFPALNIAFWSKSSAATLPITLQCAKERLGISEKTAGFSLPICTTINMNGCAAFIIITVLFVSMSSGIHFSAFDMIAWIFIATLAAFGNAGVPMGCYFLSMALLTSMDVPLDLMFVILPFYVFIDMVETAINVWSDACVTAVVDKEENP